MRTLNLLYDARFPSLLKETSTDERSCMWTIAPKEIN